MGKLGLVAFSIVLAGVGLVANAAATTTTASKGPCASYAVGGRRVCREVLSEQRRLDRLHKAGKLSDDQYNKLTAEVTGLKTALDAAASGGFTKSERQALQKQLRTVRMDVAEALHADGREPISGTSASDDAMESAPSGGGATSTGTGTATGSSAL